VSGSYQLAASAVVPQLTGYMEGTAAPQRLRGVVYADAGGGPGALVAVSSEVTVAANAPAAWIDLVFASAPTLQAGRYWVGYWFGGGVAGYHDTVPGAGRYVAAPYSPTGSPPATFGAGSGDSIAFSLYAVLGVSAPVNTSLPLVSGQPAIGQVLSSDQGSWSGGPTGFAYQWRRCDAGGGSCADVSGATASTYTLGAGDVGSTVRVVVTASNSSGSASATSQQTAVVQSSVPPATTLGRTTIGASRHNGGAGYLEVSGSYQLTAPASTSRLSGYVEGISSVQRLRGVVYADAGGAPGALVGVSSEVTVPANAPAAWVDFVFPSAPTLPAGRYWLGYWFGGGVFGYHDTVAGAGRYAAAPYSSTGSPPASFGAGTADSLAYSVYAVLGVSAPVNAALPVVSGQAVVGQVLSADQGSWGGGPTGFAYQWRRCDAGGASCADAAGETGSTYSVAAGDLGGTLRVVVTASNSVGSASATSVQTGVVQTASSGSSTLGRSSVGTSTHGGGAGYVEVSGSYLLNAPAVVSRLSGYLQGASTVQRLRAVVYADAGGVPGAFLGVSGEVTVAPGAPAGWVDFALPSGLSLPAGRYWLGYWFAGGVIGFYDSVAAGGRYAAVPYSPTATPPASFGTGTGDSIGWSLYATLGTS
jgi:hypothetical protein